MKKKTLLILAVLITALACLFTSCSASVEPPKAEEEFGYVTFGNGGSRSLSTEYGIKSYDKLYWYYTAEKKDGFGKTGETRDDAGNLVETRINDTKGLSGVITLSQGAWKFNLYAYESVKTDNTGNNLVYHGESATIVLKGGETKAVPVSVSLQGDYGTLDFSDAYFAWYKETTEQVVGTGDVYLRINISGTPDNNSVPLDKKIITKVISPEYKISNVLTFDDSYGANKFPAGYYTCTVQAYVAEDLSNTEDLNTATIKADSTYKASQAFGLRVYGNAITKIKGDLTEGLFADVSFDVAKQDMKVFVPVSDGITKIDNINAVPDATTVTGVTKSTTVEFGIGALTAVADKTLQLDVKVTTVEAANNKFNISGITSDNESAFAGIDVTLWATDTTGSSEIVRNFATGTNATVTTYIATGLSNVSVHYTPKANDPENIKKYYKIGTEEEFNNKTVDGYYDSQTGKLVFKTNHFSEFYVLADCVALNVNKNIGYKDLVEAINSANSGDTIELYRHVNLTSALLIGKSIVIDGNDHNIFNTANRVIRITEPNLDVKLYNLGVISKCTAGSDVRGISFDDASSGSSLLLDGCTVSASFYAIHVVYGSENHTITIKNGTVAAGWAAINTFSNNSSFVIENSTLRGLNDKGESSWNNFATIVFDGNNLWGEDIGRFGSHNTMYITNSTIYASSNSSNKQRWLSIQYGAQNNHITLDSETKIIDASGSDQSENITTGPFVGYDSTKKRYLKSYDVHSLLTVDSEMINICYHGEIDYYAILDNGSHVPYEGCEDIEWSKVVTITPEKVSSTTWNSDTLYYLAPGQYDDFSAYLHGKENVGFWALPEATFTKVEIGYHAGQDSSLSAKQNSTLTIKGFNVDGHLFIHAADQKVVIEGNTAAQISLKTYQFEDMNIQVINNTLTGGSDKTKAPQQYGLYIVPNKTNYNLMISGNTFRGISKHAIGVQGQGDGSAETAANSIIVQNNTFESYGLDGKDGRAAFKIWEDTKYAPTENGDITESARSLVQSIKEGNNTYSNNLGANCVLGNFYDTLVPFNE